jgi:ACS family glucarate transporter-like MFS transporter
MAEFALTKIQMGYVFSAFALAYAAFEIPTARYADRAGTREVLTRIVLWWSAFTMLTGAAFNFASLLAARFLFGAGEAGAWPCAARVFASWIPNRERGLVQGFFFSAAFLAGALTPFVVAAMTPHMSWRLVLVVFGGLGVAWALLWQRWYRSDAAEHGGVNPAEFALIRQDCSAAPSHSTGGVFWRQLLLNRHVLALCLMYFPNSFVFYFCITWLPTYLKERHHFDGTWVTVFTGLPLFLSAVSVVLGGWALDRLVARFGDRAGRCGLGAAAYAVAALALFAVPFSPDPMLAAALIAVAMAANTFTLSAAWGACIRLGGRNAGVVGATMNTASQIGSLICPTFVAYSLKWFNSWDVPLLVMGGLFAVGVACWLVIDTRPLQFGDRSGPT